MQSFIKISGAVLEKNANEIMTLCNFNKDFNLGSIQHYFKVFTSLKINILEEVVVGNFGS